MNSSDIYSSILGGGLIGIAVTIMLLFNGRVTGISGIISSSLSKPTADGMWRWMFILGLIVGGTAMFLFSPQLFENTSGRTLPIVAIAGILVGFGTVMGGGCTSGHGICGISRFSMRSIVATITFMLFGFLTVQAIEYFGGSAL